MTTYQPPRWGAIVAATQSLAAIAVGSAILAASAFAVIHAGHQDLPHAILTSSLALGVLAGSAIIGRAWSTRRRVLAIAIGLALFSGEGFNLVATADRIVAEREKLQASVRDAKARHDSSMEELKRTQKAHDAADQSFKEAITAQTKTAVDGVTSAISKDCRDRCKLALDTANSTSAGAVTIAQKALELAKGDLDKARQVYRSNPAPTASGSPLADRTGIPAWAIDLTIAALLSLGANGLAAALIAFGAHSTRAADVSAQTSFPTADPPPAATFVPDVDMSPAAEREQMVVDFVRAHVARHGRMPRHNEVMKATGLPRATTSRHLKRARAIA